MRSQLQSLHSCWVGRFYGDGGVPGTRRRGAAIPALYAGAGPAGGATRDAPVVGRGSGRGVTVIKEKKRDKKDSVFSELSTLPIQFLSVFIPWITVTPFGAYLP